MNVVISDEAHDGWRNFAAIHGANVTALVEAIGLAMAEFTDQDEEQLPDLARDTGAAGPPDRRPTLSPPPHLDGP